MRENALTNGGGELFTPGGFEIVASPSVVSQRREHLLAAWRQASFAMHGLHVTDRNQVIKAPVLADGAPMTMEIREAIAAARAKANKAYSAAAHRAGKLDYINDAELDGVLPKQDWEKSFRYVESTLGPPRVVKARVLPTPSGETQRRVNQAFLELIKDNVSQAETMVLEHLENWARTETRRMTWWAPKEVEPLWFETYGRFQFPRAWAPRTSTVSRVVDFAKLQESGQTFRAWFQSRIATALGDILDDVLFRELSPHIRLEAISTVDALLAAPGKGYRAWALDPAALTHLGRLENECIVPESEGWQIVWGQVAYPFRERLALARELEPFESAALHIEPPTPFRVEINPVKDRPDCYDVSASYTGTLHIPAAAAKHCWLAYLT